MLDNRWEAESECIQFSFLSRILIKTAKATSLKTKYQVQMLDVVHLDPCPEELFVVYYITAKVDRKRFE